MFSIGLDITKILLKAHVTVDNTLRNVRWTSGATEEIRLEAFETQYYRIS